VALFVLSGSNCGSGCLHCKTALGHQAFAL
jgi:hypothetical protein